MQAWYLVYTKPQQERLAVENLGQQDFETYLPVLWNRRRRARKSVARLEPMFPRYLFIHLDGSTDDWGPIRSTVGVANMVRFANRAAKVPDALIATLQSREDGEGVQQLERCALARGEKGAHRGRAVCGIRSALRSGYLSIPGPDFAGYRWQAGAHQN